MLLYLRAFANRDQLQRPEQNLPEMAGDLGLAVLRGHRRSLPANDRIGLSQKAGATPGFAFRRHEVRPCRSIPTRRSSRRKSLCCDQTTCEASRNFRMPARPNANVFFPRWGETGALPR